jgi:gamma-glutamyltranspeptidase/glutathione hydrolase
VPDLQPVPVRHAANGMVAAIDHLAAGAGLDALRRGGSAADAAVATSAVLAVTSQHLCGMGGDLWAVVHPGPGEEVVALDASGRAGSGADPDRLTAAGHTTVPATGDVAAVPVPGCVDGWLALHRRFGRLAWPDLLVAARRYATDGFPASPGLVAALPRVAGLPDAADYRAAGPVRPGTLVRRPGVARALADLAGLGRAGFYGGEFGAGLLALGAGEYTADDLDRPLADWVAPVAAEAWGHRLWTAPPASQGYLTVAAAWIADGLDVPVDPADPQWAHLLIEACRQAGHDRVAVLHEGADGAALVAPARLAARRAAVRADAAGDLGGPGAAGDTVALCAVDADRQGVSLIQSNASGWGSGLIVPGVRIFLHNRGCGFSLRPGHPAAYGPGRRPPHTLSPLVVTAGDGTLRAVLGTMGGDSQPQILLQLAARLLHGAEDAAGAVAAGRFSLCAPPGADGVPTDDGFGTWTGGGRVGVRLEGHAPAWDAALRRLGHVVGRDEAWSGAFGHAHVIHVGDAVLTGGSDPRPLAGGVVGW